MLFHFHVVCWNNVTKIIQFIKTKTKENTYKDIINSYIIYLKLKIGDLESQVSQTSELSREVKPVPRQAAAHAVIQGPLIASERLPVGKKYI